jgi:hypothetical protein
MDAGILGFAFPLKRGVSGVTSMDRACIMCEQTIILPPRVERVNINRSGNETKRLIIRHDGQGAIEIK